jgi:hypothetical protein
VNATFPSDDGTGVQSRTPSFNSVTPPRAGSAVQMWRVRRSVSMRSNAICLPSDEMLTFESYEGGPSWPSSFPVRSNHSSRELSADVVALNATAPVDDARERRWRAHCGYILCNQRGLAVQCQGLDVKQLCRECSFGAGRGGPPPCRATARCVLRTNAPSTSRFVGRCSGFVISLTYTPGCGSRPNQVERALHREESWDTRSRRPE